MAYLNNTNITSQSSGKSGVGFIEISLIISKFCISNKFIVTPVFH